MLDLKFLDHVINTNNVSKVFYRFSTSTYKIHSSLKDKNSYDVMTLYTNNYIADNINKHEQMQVYYFSTTNEVRVLVYSKSHLKLISKLIEYLKSASRAGSFNLIIAKKSKNIMQQEIVVYYDSQKESSKC